LKKDIMINKINTTTMKTKVTLLLAVFAVAFSGNMLAQMDECVTTASLFIEPAKAKNYEAALPHYDKVVTECPKYSLATYQYAEKMFKYFVEKGDKSKVAAYVKNFEMQEMHFPAKSKDGKNMAKIAQLKYDNEMGTKAQQFAAFDEAYKTDEETFTSPKSLYTYFSLARELFDSNEKDIQEVFDLYDIIQDKISKEESKYASRLSELIDKEEAGTVLTSKEQKKVKGYETNLGSYGLIKGSIDTKLGAIADCTNLVPLYEKLWEEKKNDVDWLKSSAGKLNSKDCDTPLFFQMVQQLHSLQPSAASAFYLGRLAEKAGKASEALDYYNQAVDLETDPNKKVGYYSSIAENFYKKGSYGQARSYFRKVLELKPNSGRAYLKIAAMYNKSANSCGSSPFEKRAINWLAAQMADKAARVDPSIAGSARSAANSYRGLAPSKTDIFSSGMAGKTVSFNCWVGGSVRVPSL
jgi:tetratricopeptide (TPR) repeat protein